VNFAESIEYLYELGNEVLAMKLGLENIQKLLKALDHPEENYLKVQIAGTNGKGSTCVFLESICLAAGIKVGTTTSPHLVSVAERIRINGHEISETDFARFATRVRETSEQLVANHQAANGENKSAIRNPQSAISLETVPTFFEQVTAIALLAFSGANIELAILETGLGGRFDATTAAGAEIVAITPIDFDHERILGDTLPLIAAEKAAIIRRNTKAVIAPQQRQAEQVILDRCREVGVAPVLVPKDFQIKNQYYKKDRPVIFFNFTTENDIYHDIVLGMAGKHQIVNAMTAVSLAETLRDFGFRLEKEDIWKGLEKARHRGRLEYNHGMLFDGAHNASGAKALREYLDEFIRRPITIVFGAMSDKNLAEIAAILFPRAEKLILTAPANPRSMNAGDFRQFVPADFPPENVFFTETVAEALKIAREISSGNLICVTGSLYLIGEVQELLNKA
jgi:dihydrofolate synthase/folylpolyglutamate synthase